MYQIELLLLRIEVVPDGNCRDFSWKQISQWL